MATYAGISLGIAVHVQTVAVPTAVYKVSYAGVNGVFALFMGTRGFVHHVDGCLVSDTLADLLAVEAAFRLMPQVITNELADDCGRVYENVIWEGEYVPSPGGPKYTDFGVILPYTATFYGLL
jgi:hypothetical protein